MISLVMATVGRTADVANFIASLATQTYRNFELIVVDQNRDDRLKDAVEEAGRIGCTVHWLRLDQRGLSMARNVGIARATGDYIAFPDDDCWYEPDTLTRVMARFEADASLVGVVGSWVENEPTAEEDQTFELSAFRRFRMPACASFTLFFRTDAVRNVHGFDEMLGVGRWFGAAEETDLLLRLLTHGASLSFEPGIRVHHPNKSSSTIQDPDRIRERFKSYSRGTGAMYAKHRLSPIVILRGLVAPLMKALVPPWSRGKWIAGMATFQGRVEGYRHWPNPPSRDI